MSDQPQWFTVSGGSRQYVKKVCAEFELEVLDEDIEAFMAEELEKEEKGLESEEVFKFFSTPFYRNTRE